MNKIRNVISEDLDKRTAQLGAVFSLLLLVYFSSKDNSLIYMLTALLTFSSCLFWLAVRATVSLENHKPISKKFVNTLLISLFFFLFSLHIILLYNRESLYERPFSYFILVSILAFIVTLEIYALKSRTSIYLIIIQIVLIGLSLCWSQQLVSHSLIGIDPWFHQDFTYQIIESNHIQPGSYSKLPVFHLLIAFTLLITGLDYKLASMLSVSLSQIICNVLFIILIAKFIYPKHYQLSCLSALLVIISNHHIFMTYWPIPNGFAAVFIIPLFYSATSIKKYNHTLGTIFSILFGIMIILTHAITALFTAIALFIYWGSYHIYCFLNTKQSDVKNCTEEMISLSFCTLFSVMMFGWWTYVSGHIITLSQLIEGGLGENLFVNTPDYIIAETINYLPFFERLINNIGMFSFFSLSLIGLFYMISKKNRNEFSFSFAFIGITPLLIGYFSLISGSSAIEERWWYFAQIMLSMPLAIGLILISRTIAKNNLRPFFLSLVVSIMAFCLIISPPANNDYHEFSSNSTMTYSLTSPELKALETSSQFWNGTIKTDKFYAGIQKYDFKTSSFDQELFYHTDVSLLNDDFVLVRKNVENKTFMAFDSLVNQDVQFTSMFESASYSNVYSSGTVEGYIFT